MYRGRTESVALGTLNKEIVLPTTVTEISTGETTDHDQEWFVTPVDVHY